MTRLPNPEEQQPRLSPGLHMLVNISAHVPGHTHTHTKEIYQSFLNSAIYIAYHGV